jgi:transcriptional regulator NrdR family protein
MFNTCEKCKSTQIAVINSREKRDYIFRRRRCVKCGETFSTREIRQSEYEFLKKEHGKLTPETRFRGIVKAYVLSLTAKEQTEFFDEIIK